MISSLAHCAHASSLLICSTVLSTFSVSCCNPIGTWFCALILCCMHRTFSVFARFIVAQRAGASLAAKRAAVAAAVKVPEIGTKHDGCVWCCLYCCGNCHWVFPGSTGSHGLLSVDRFQNSSRPGSLTPAFLKLATRGRLACGISFCTDGLSHVPRAPGDWRPIDCSGVCDVAINECQASQEGRS